MCHCTMFISIVTDLLFFITMHQEDGVIQCYTQLQNCCQCLRDIGNLSHKVVTSQVIDNRDSDTEHEEDWYKE